MRTTIVISILLSLLPALAFGQFKNPVSVSFSSKKVSDKIYNIIATLDIKPSWHVYALKGGDGPVSTSLNIKKHPLVSPDGDVKEKGEKIKKYESVFESDVQYFEKKVQFIQQVKLKKDIKVCVPVEIEYMVCDDKSCLPPTTKSACVPIK